MISKTLTVAVICIGGMHQALHVLPVAIALIEKEGCAVSIYTGDTADSIALAQLVAQLGAQPIPIVTMNLPRILEYLVRLRQWLEHKRTKPGPKRSAKRLRLLLWSRSLRRHDAILTAERTSTFLKRMPGRMPAFIHIPHGAGDRAKGFEQRIAQFDHVIVSGPKDQRRMIAQGLVSAEHCSVSGSIKVEACRLLQQNVAPIFDNDRPVILYNPHFDHHLSSWQAFAQPLIDAIVADGRFNLVVAPHIRMFEGASQAERDQWLAHAITGRVIIDLDSPRLNTMHYTSRADIYIDDVSSQVYEFLSVLKPCIFIDAHAVKWRDNQDYAMWQFGDVCRDLAQVMDALNHATSCHTTYRDIQQRMVRDALGDSSGHAAQTAAKQLIAAVETFHTANTHQ